MRRAALYARFSTEHQSDRSVDDQLALCEGFARAQGLTITGRYFDRARSGTTVHGRDGLSELLQDARAGGFDVIIVEALDRLSRDQEDLAGLHKRLTFLGIEIVAVHDGKADALQVGIRGLVSSLWIADLKHKIRRGMTGRVKDGKSAGGRAYGYRPTPGDPGKPTVHEAEAAVIRRIFAEYLAGRSPRDIAIGLNTEGVPAPRGASWQPEIIGGNPKRGHGILRNSIYAGRLVWNRVKMVRDPDTGRRVSRPNPPDQWQHADAPQLAIIDADTWDAVQARLQARSIGPVRRERDRRGRILSGLLRCGECGGSLYVHEQSGPFPRVMCRAAKMKACANGRTYNLHAIERAVIDGVAERLKHPDAIRKWLEEQQSERRADSKARARVQQDVERLRAKITRMSRMLVEGRVAEDFFDTEMPQVRAELAALEARLAASPATPVVTLHPASVASYADALADLGRVLTTGHEDRDLIEAFRLLIDRVTIVNGPEKTVICEVVGPLGPLLDRHCHLLVAEVRFPKVATFLWGRFAA